MEFTDFMEKLSLFEILALSNRQKEIEDIMRREF